MYLPCISSNLEWNLFLREKKLSLSLSFLSDCNGIRSHDHLVRTRTLNYLAKLSFPIITSFYDHEVLRYTKKCFEAGVLL